MDKYNKLYMVGFTGRKFVGKSTMADILEYTYKEIYDTHILSFGDHVKECVKLIFGLSDSDVYTQEGKQRVVKGTGLTVVEVLQRFATEFVREISPDLWVNVIQNKVQEIFENSDRDVLIILDDVRFPNECTFVRNHGLLIHLERDHEFSVKEEVASHVSETSVEKRWFETSLFLPNDVNVAFSMVSAVFLANMEIRYKKEK